MYILIIVIRDLLLSQAYPRQKAIKISMLNVQRLALVSLTKYFTDWDSEAS